METIGRTVGRSVGRTGLKFDFFYFHFLLFYSLNKTVFGFFVAQKLEKGCSFFSDLIFLSNVTHNVIKVGLQKHQKQERCKKVLMFGKLKKNWIKKSNDEDIVSIFLSNNYVHQPLSISPIPKYCKIEIFIILKR